MGVVGTAAEKEAAVETVAEMEATAAEMAVARSACSQTQDTAAFVIFTTHY